MFGRSRQARQQTTDTRPALAAPPPRLEQMFVAHHAMVWRTLRRRGLAADTASDVVQQTFLIAAERLEDIQADSERAFLVGTALRVARTMGRKTMRWQLEEDMDRRVGEATGQAGDLGTRARRSSCAIWRCRRWIRTSPRCSCCSSWRASRRRRSRRRWRFLWGRWRRGLRRAREQFRRVVTRIESTMQREGTA